MIYHTVGQVQLDCPIPSEDDGGHLVDTSHSKWGLEDILLVEWLNSGMLDKLKVGLNKV